jgi:hypothetical protein
LNIGQQPNVAQAPHRLPIGRHHPLDAALRFAEQSWAVLPTRPATKAPLTDNGVHDASTDPDIITGWWERWPRANVAIAVEPSGLVVLDIDPKPGAVEFWRNVERRCPAAHDTLTVLSPSGGFHKYYRALAGQRIPRRISGLHAGVDVLGAGYVIAPPSRTGRGVYHWHAGLYHDGEPARLPGGLLELIDSVRGHPSATQAIPSKIDAGRRHDALVSLAGRLRHWGMTSDEILAALQAVNDGRCVPPLGADELAAIAMSIARYPPMFESAGRLGPGTRWSRRYG